MYPNNYDSAITWNDHRIIVAGRENGIDNARAGELLGFGCTICHPLQ